MTEYWQSQARKYCDFCKCWLADNKVSISFHENGKKHKENVQKHISKLTKSSAKEAKKKEKIDDEMMKMEEAAMKAYLKDVENNADITSQNLNKMLDEKLGTSGSTSSKSSGVPAPTVGQTRKPVWHELKSEDGNTYFWNTESNETTWDPPDDYLSLAQQEAQKLRNEELTKKNEKLKKQREVEEQKESAKERKAALAREQMKARAVKPEPAISPAAGPAIGPTAGPAIGPAMGPAPAAQPYGKWTTIVTQPVEKVDLQLPKVEKVVIPPPVVMVEEEYKFGEKRVESLGEGPVEFKRRKFGNARRNLRQKVDDD